MRFSGIVAALSGVRAYFCSRMVDAARTPDGVLAEAPAERAIEMRNITKPTRRHFRQSPAVPTGRAGDGALIRTRITGTMEQVRRIVA
jgi:hypothetical protein